MDLSNKKVLFIDLDGTLIETASGDTFPRGIWDVKFKLEVLDAIKSWLKSSDTVKYVFVVSNQGGIEKGLVDEFEFANKACYVTECIRSLSDNSKLVVGAKWCPDISLTHRRKPNTGMLEEALHRYTVKFIDKSQMFMVGDASGLEGQFSDSDKKCAENFGIDYLDVNEFVKHDT